MKININGITREMTAEEIAEMEINVPSVDYNTMVIELIRERYSLDEELAIQRQRDTKVDEFEQYFDYCEECKARAKIESEA